MRALSLLLLVLGSTLAWGQKNPFYITQRIPDKDSLLAIIRETKETETKLNAYRELGFMYFENRRDSAMRYCEKELLLAQQTDQPLWEADARVSIGFLSYVQGNYPRAFEFLLQAKKLVEDPAIERKAWPLSDKTKVSPSIARRSILSRLHNHLSSLYGFAGDFKDNVDLEFLHFNEAMRVAQGLNDQQLQAIIQMNMARHYALGTDHLDSVLKYANQSLAYMDQSGYTRYKGSVLSYLGRGYSKQQDYVNAKMCYWKAIVISRANNNLRSLGESYLALSNLYRSTSTLDSSLYYGRAAVSTFQSTAILSGLVDSYASLSESYQQKRVIDSAYHYQGLAIKARESLSAEDKLRQFQSIRFDEQLKVQQEEKDREASRNRMITFGLLAIVVFFMAIALLLAQNNRNRKKANQLLQAQKEKLEETLAQLKATQSQLIQSEKMASLGELTAGIAHEIQNPLNFVNNFSEVSNELVDEMKSHLATGNWQPATEIANDLKQNLEKINHHGKRADAIVKGMLQHSRKSTGQKELTDINALCDEYLRLAYHGLRAKDKSFNAKLETHLDPNLPKINVVPQDIGRVVLNLINNAFYACTERSRSALSQQPIAKSQQPYEPTVTVSTKAIGNKIEIRVKDNGPGIPDHIKDKIFQPFFTTKPTGQGTGLGLSLSYDIITKGHGGELTVDTKEGEGSVLTIILPA